MVSRSFDDVQLYSHWICVVLSIPQRKLRKNSRLSGLPPRRSALYLSPSEMTVGVVEVVEVLEVAVVAVDEGEVVEGGVAEEEMEEVAVEIAIKTRTTHSTSRLQMLQTVEVTRGNELLSLTVGLILESAALVFPSFNHQKSRRPKTIHSASLYPFRVDCM